MSSKVNMVMEQGATFSVSFTVHEANGAVSNTTGYTANSMFRRSYTSSNSYSFATSVANNGVVTLAMSANATANVADGRYFYDVKLTTAANDVIRVMEGILTVTPGIAR